VTNKTVKLCYGTAELTIDDEGFGVIDKEARFAFTNGQCHALAVALHRLTGWPIKGASYDRYEDDSPTHCVVYWRERRVYVDVNGASRQVRIDGTRFYISHRYIDPHTAANRLSYYIKPDLTTAALFARTILRDLGIEV